MSVDTIFHFPEEEVIEKYLTNDDFFEDKYFKEKGITAIVAKLAAEHFADKKLVESGVKLLVEVMFDDLIKGESSIMHEKISKIDLSPIVLHLLKQKVQKDIFKCSIYPCY